VIEFVAIVAGRRDKPLQSIHVELLERLAQAEASAATWKEKYEGLAGFSAHLSIMNHGAQYLRMKATQDVEVIGLDYCLGDGVCIVADDAPGHCAAISAWARRARRTSAHQPVAR